MPVCDVQSQRTSSGREMCPIYEMKRKKKKNSEYFVSQWQRRRPTTTTMGYYMEKKPQVNCMDIYTRENLFVYAGNKLPVIYIAKQIINIFLHSIMRRLHCRLLLLHRIYTTLAVLLYIHITYRYIKVLLVYRMYISRKYLLYAFVYANICVYTTMNIVYTSLLWNTCGKNVCLEFTLSPAKKTYSRRYM